MEMLRFATAGSVDDGKSTLIGRLLWDSKLVFGYNVLGIHEFKITADSSFGRWSTVDAENRLRVPRATRFGVLRPPRGA